MKIKKKKDEFVDKDDIMDDLTGLYAPCHTKDKKVCGKIVKPIERQEQIGTAELVKSLLAEEEELILCRKKKHKHKDPEKKHKKREFFFLNF